jgi:outer membrane murein-binding lipoprotein Lpp
MAENIGKLVSETDDKPAQGKAGMRGAYERGPTAASRKVLVFAARACLVCLAVTLATGCGNYKEKLQEAQQRIDKLTSENKRLAETVASLTKEKTSLTEKLASAEKKGLDLESQVAVLKKSNMELSESKAELQTQQNDTRKEMATISRDKTDLAEENERLKRQIAATTTDAGDQALKEGMPGARPSEGITKPSEGLSPCDAVLEYMRKCQQAVRGQHGELRAKLLAELKQQYTPKMKGAPEKALLSSAAWVNELAKSWDKPGDNTVLNLLLNRNEVLHACDKTPAEAGF